MTPVSYTHLDVYKRQVDTSKPISAETWGEPTLSINKDSYNTGLTKYHACLLYTSGLGDFSLEVIGERPCGQSADVSFLKDRVERAFAGAGQRVVFASASTDCNLPMSVGIPAVSFGVCKGVGAHTEEEYILLDTLLPGMEILLRFFFGL